MGQIFDANFSLRRTLVFKEDGNGVKGFDEIPDAIGPFDDDDGVGADEFIETEGFELSGLLQSIRVDVVEKKSSFVFVDEGEGGAGHLMGVFDVEPFRDSFDEVSFSGSQLADESDDFAALERAAKGATVLDGLRDVLAEEFGGIILHGNAAILSG